jgi:signal transduction histidine kinase
VTQPQPRALTRSALWRMSLGFAGAFALAALLMLALVMRTASSYTERRIAETIATDLKGFEDIFQQSGISGLKEAMERRLSWDANRLYMLVDGEGALLSGNTTQWPNNEGGTVGGPIRFTDKARDRAFDGATRVLPSGVKILLAQDRREHDKILAGLWRALVWPSIGVLLLALGGGYLITRRMLGRIEAVNATCRAVEGGDLSARVRDAARGSDEFATLGAHVNAMLDRIERLMGSVQHLSDHIAHETRTPLARLRARLERAKAETTADPTTVAAFDDAIEETQTIINIFAALLDITAAEAATGDGRGLVRVNLATVIADIVDLYEGVAEDKGVTLATDAASATILGEPMLLMRMIANVVDNAIKFSPAGGRVSMILTGRGAEAVLTIADQGPGIPDDFANSAFERFSRADAAQSKPGHGLGLPLVKAIALRHGIRLTMTNAAPGLAITFIAPLATTG